MTSLPLEGIKIVDLSIALTGPMTTRNLAAQAVWRTVSVTGVPATPLPAARSGMRLTRQFKTLAWFAVLALVLLSLLPADTAGIRIGRSVFFLVGAGFSSLRHILQTAPDVIKLDRTIVDGVSADPVLRSLVRSLVDFAEGCDARVGAEGVDVETGQQAVASQGAGHAVELRRRVVGRDADRRQHHDPSGQLVAQHVLDHLERRGVGPLEVIEDDEHRVDRRLAAQELGEHRVVAIALAA